MKSYCVSQSKLSGSLKIPSSKSQSIRAILFASMAQGNSTIQHYLNSPDIHAMIEACRQLGAVIDVKPNEINIVGTDAHLQTPDNIIDAGNSGQVLRFIACLAGLQNQYMVITGDHSIRHNRTVEPIIESLQKLGMECQSLRGDNHAPIIIKGPFMTDETHLSGEDSQPVSGLIMALAFKKNVSTIVVRNPGEKLWIDLTLGWLDRFNIPYKNHEYRRYQIEGGANIEGFNYHVPGDLSSLSFPLAAAAITRSHIVIHNVDLNEPQGDKAIVNVLRQMGAKIEYNETENTITVAKTETLQGIDININDFIDCVAIIAVLGCFATGVTTITGAAIARKKESDRLTAISTELTKMGADIKELPDGLIIKQSTLHPAKVDSHHDHRIAMSLAVAALATEGKTLINDVICVDKSFPLFASAMQGLNANISEIESSL